MSSEFTKHFGNTRILGCIMGGWNSKLPMEILQEKHPSRPLSVYQKQRIPNGSSFGIFVALQSFSSWWSLKLQQIVMSIRDGPPLSHTYCWVIEIWRSKKNSLRFVDFVVYLTIYDRFGFHTSISEASTVRVTHLSTSVRGPVRGPWGSHPPGSSKLRLLPRRCAKYKCCWQEWKLDRSREAKPVEPKRQLNKTAPGLVGSYIGNSLLPRLCGDNKKPWNKDPYQLSNNQYKVFFVAQLCMFCL